MKETLIFTVLILLIVMIAAAGDRKQSRFEFMSRDHSAVYRGIAALIIMIQHFASKFETRVFIPLGGIGVAIFLVSSGYGLNESYKKKKSVSSPVTWGGIGDIK